ncbi:MAG: AarF/ABC1/UbiB kinase family protein [Myxococcota bacterium]|nr:AarF/ABC1/UbiB kinase family protein [Myxococcota bacterium]
MLKEAFQDLNRVRQIAVIAARYGFGEWLERGGLWRSLGRKEEVEVTPEAKRATAARRFRMMLNELGPTFIKLGQVLSTRADLLPKEFVAELAGLQDQVAPFPLEQVNEQIRTSLGRSLEELFARIEPSPLAAASIAQVHRAVTHDGQEVVVKVQRPGITEQIRADLAVLRYLARALEATVEESGIYSPTGILDEFDRAIHEELDFLNEAANVRAFYANHVERPGMRIPQVFDTLSSRTVLTLEFLPGVKISNIDLKKHDPQKLARAIIDDAFRQLFVDGLFHGDPHPGNILVQENDTIALLDFGLVGRLSKPMQDTLVMLVLAVALKDSDSVARILYRLGVPDGRANLAGFRADVDAVLSQTLPTTLGKIDTRRVAEQLLDLAVKYRIRIPKEYAILSRAAVAIEGVIRTLHPDLNVMEVAMPYAKELLAGRYDPTQLQGGLMRTLFRLQGLANDLPVQLSQILLDLETGKFEVNVRATQFETLNSSLRSAAVIAFLGLCACGFIVGSFMAFSQNPWMVGGIPVLGVIGVAASAMLFGATFSWYLFAGRVHKVRLSRFLKKK